MSVSSFSLRPRRRGGWWRSFGYLAWVVASVIGLSAVIIFYALKLLVEPLSLTEEKLTQPDWLLGLYAAQYGLGLAIMLIVPLVFEKQTRDQLVAVFGIMRRPRFGDFGKALLAFVPYFLITAALQAIIISLVPGFNADQAQNIGFSNLVDPLELTIAFLALVVLAPLAEELIFRGYLFGSIRRELSFWPAAILVSVLFGLVHGQWNVALDTFVLSLVLCYLREKTGSIWAGVGLHAIKNGLAYALLFILPLTGVNLLQ